MSTLGFTGKIKLNRSKIDSGVKRFLLSAVVVTSMAFGAEAQSSATLHSSPANQGQLFQSVDNSIQDDGVGRIFSSLYNVIETPQASYKISGKESGEFQHFFNSLFNHARKMRVDLHSLNTDLGAHPDLSDIKNHLTEISTSHRHIRYQEAYAFEERFSKPSFLNTSGHYRSSSDIHDLFQTLFSDKETIHKLSELIQESLSKNDPDAVWANISREERSQFNTEMLSIALNSTDAKTDFSLYSFVANKLSAEFMNAYSSGDKASDNYEAIVEKAFDEIHHYDSSLTREDAVNLMNWAFDNSKVKDGMLERIEAYLDDDNKALTELDTLTEMINEGLVQGQGMTHAAR